MRELVLGFAAFFALVPAWAGVGAWSSLVSPSLKGSNVIVISLGKHPTNASIRYAATQSGMFKSSDGGQSWLISNSGIAPTPAGYFGVNDMVVDPQSGNIYIAPNYLQKSVDGGNSWGRTGWVTENPQALKLALDPKTPTTVYAGSNQGVYKSIDGAVTWKYMAGNSPVYALAIDPGNPSVLYRAVASGIYKTTDGGLTWNQVNSRLIYVSVIAVDPRNSMNIYVGTSGAGVYKSADSGATWNAVNQCYPVRGSTVSLNNAFVSAFAFDSGNSSIVYLGAGDGIYRSVDGGARWTQANNGPMPGVRTLMIDPNSPDTVIAGNNYGLYSYTFPTASSDWDRVFNWAEVAFPQYFSPAGATTQPISGYQARYYTNTNTYLASQNGDIYVYGAVFGGLLRVGTVANYLSLAIDAGY